MLDKEVLRQLVDVVEGIDRHNIDQQARRLANHIPFYLLWKSLVDDHEITTILENLTSGDKWNGVRRINSVIQSRRSQLAT